MSCHHRKTCMVFEHSFLVLARPDVWKRDQGLYTSRSISSLLCGCCSSRSYLYIILHLAISDNARYHKLVVQSQAQHNWSSPSGKQQAVHTNNDYTDGRMLTNSFQKQSNDSSIAVYIHCWTSYMNHQKTINFPPSFVQERTEQENTDRTFSVLKTTILRPQSTQVTWFFCHCWLTLSQPN